MCVWKRDTDCVCVCEREILKSQVLCFGQKLIYLKKSSTFLSDMGPFLQKLGRLFAPTSGHTADHFSPQADADSSRCSSGLVIELDLCTLILTSLSVWTSFLCLFMVVIISSYINQVRLFLHWSFLNILSKKRERYWLCVWEREREKDRLRNVCVRERYWLCVWERERDIDCLCEREREILIVRVRERQKDG